MPVLVTIMPETADIIEEPKQNESILKNLNDQIYPLLHRGLTLTVHQPLLRRLQELENKEEDKMTP